MINMSHNLRSALLLAILLGFAAVNAHAAVHLGGSNVDCKLCMTHHNPPVFIVPSQLSHPIAVSTPVPFEQRVLPQRVAPLFHIQQRGPPSLIR